MAAQDQRSTARSTSAFPSPGGPGADFRWYRLGQTISSLGSAFTSFALPLIVYRLTGSAMDLAFSSLAGSLPMLLFGLIIGAWVDRINRQTLVPNALLGRVSSTLNVLVNAATPMGVLIGGMVVERTGSVALLFGACGLLILLIALVFRFTPLARAEEYLPEVSPSHS